MPELSIVSAFLLRCLIINYLILLCWFGSFAFAHEGLYGLHQRWFSISRVRFDTIHYAGMAVYKIGILLFNLAPLLAICTFPSAGH